LCSNAAHIARSQRLHCQTDIAGSVPSEKELTSRWLWWTLYALEKHHTLRVNLPSSIDEDSVTTEIPATIPVASNIYSQNLRFGVQHARIRSQISKRFSSKSFAVSLDELTEAVDQFDEQLKQLLDGMPPELRIGRFAKSSFPTRRLVNILYLHFSIYESLIAVHVHFFYPWLTSRFTSDVCNAQLEARIAHSSTAVAEASRNIILALRLFDSDVAIPSWLAYDFPVYAATNLFIYILKYPMNSTCTADLALLDMCAGHFGHIDFLTSHKVFTSLPREVAKIACQAVREAKANKSTTLSAEVVQSRGSREAQSASGSPHVTEAMFDAFRLDSTTSEDASLQPLAHVIGFY
jgi:hypothetical protein